MAIYNTTDRSRFNDPQSVLDGIAKRNWADIELYEFAKELFETEKQTVFPLIKEESIQWVKEIIYDFTALLDGWGWSPREHLTEGAFCWFCSSKKGIINFPLNAGHDNDL